MTLFVELLIVVVLVLLNGLLVHVRTGSGLGAPGAAQGAGRRRQQGRGHRAQARRGSGQVPLLGADRHHPRRRPVGRLLGRDAGRPAGAVPARRRVSPIVCASAIGVGVVVVLITYFSLIVGELVPKQLALRDAERIAAQARADNAVHRHRRGAAGLAARYLEPRRPARCSARSGASEDRVTDEEVRTIIAEAESQGVLESEEKAMISGVMRFADRSARGLMTPRLDVEVVDLSDPDDDIQQILRTSHHSMLPVHEGEPDQIIGVLVRKDLIDIFADGLPLDVRALVKPAPVVLDRADALSVLRAIRSSPVHVALVFDEYGHFEGIVTPGDILGRHHRRLPGRGRRRARLHPARGWLLPGLGLDAGRRVRRQDRRAGAQGPEIRDRRGLRARPSSTTCRRSARRFVREPWRFEVLDLDGRRIDKVLVSKHRLERDAIRGRRGSRRSCRSRRTSASTMSISLGAIAAGGAGYRDLRPASPWRASRCARRPDRTRWP